jgi:hypothetical protein
VAPQAKTTLEALLARLPINGSRPRTVRKFFAKILLIGFCVLAMLSNLGFLLVTITFAVAQLAVSSREIVARFFVEMSIASAATVALIALYEGVVSGKLDRSSLKPFWGELGKASFVLIASLLAIFIHVDLNSFGFSTANKTVGEWLQVLYYSCAASCIFSLPQYLLLLLTGFYGKSQRQAFPN